MSSVWNEPICLQLVLASLTKLVNKCPCASIACSGRAPCTLPLTPITWLGVHSAWKHVCYFKRTPPDTGAYCHHSFDFDTRSTRLKWTCDPPVNSLVHVWNYSAKVPLHWDHELTSRSCALTRAWNTFQRFHPHMSFHWLSSSPLGAKGHKNEWSISMFEQINSMLSNGFQWWMLWNAQSESWISNPSVYLPSSPNTSGKLGKQCASGKVHIARWRSRQQCHNSTELGWKLKLK